MVDIPMLWGSGQSGGLGGIYVPGHSASLISHACMWVRRTVLKLTKPRTVTIQHVPILGYSRREVTKRQ